MTYQDITKTLEQQGVSLFKVELQSKIQPFASGIEERIEYLNAKGYDGNEDIITLIIDDAAHLIQKLRKSGVIV